MSNFLRYAQLRSKVETEHAPLSFVFFTNVTNHILNKLLQQQSRRVAGCDYGVIKSIITIHYILISCCH